MAGDDACAVQLHTALAAAPSSTEASIVWYAIDSALQEGPLNPALVAEFAPEFIRILSGSPGQQNRNALRAALVWAGKDPGRPDLLLPLSGGIASVDVDLQGIWTQSVAQIALRTHEPGCITALAQQAVRPEFLSREFENHDTTKSAAVEALVKYGTPADFDHIAALATGGSQVVAKTLLECASSEQLAARPELIDAILTSIDSSAQGSPSFAREIALKRLAETWPLEAVTARYANAIDYYQKADADSVLARSDYGAKTEAERSAKVPELLRIIDAGEKMPVINAKRVLLDWLATRKVSADAVIDALRRPTPRMETKLLLVFDLLAARDTWTAAEACQALEAVGNSVFGTRWERRYWTLTVAYLNGEASAWAWARDAVRVRRAREPAPTDTLQRPLEELQGALDP